MSTPARWLLTTPSVVGARRGTRGNVVAYREPRQGEFGNRGFLPAGPRDVPSSVTRAPEASVAEQPPPPPRITSVLESLEPRAVPVDQHLVGNARGRIDPQS
jgi:hypothetical protein